MLGVAMKNTVIEVRLLSYVHLTDVTAVMSFAHQQVDLDGQVQKDTWLVRTTIVHDGQAGSSVIAEQNAKTQDLRPMLAKTSTRYGLGTDETAALSLVRNLR